MCWGLVAGAIVVLGVLLVERLGIDDPVGALAAHGMAGVWGTLSLGFLTVPQLADTLRITRHWIYDRIHNGTIAIARDARTGLYLFPDTPDTLAGFRQLRGGEVDRLQFIQTTDC